MSEKTDTENGEAATGGEPTDSPEEEAGPDGIDLERRLEERELGLDKRSEELDAREKRLDEREQQLDDHEDHLDERRTELDEWESDLEERAAELDDREANIEEAEAELSERARKLNEHEETLHTYIEGQVEDLGADMQDTVWSALDTYEKNRGTGRFGPTGNLIAGLAGLAVAAAGSGYAAAMALDASLVFDTTGPNLALAALLLLVGVAVTLLTVTDRF